MTAIALAARARVSPDLGVPGIHEAASMRVAENALELAEISGGRVTIPARERVGAARDRKDRLVLGSRHERPLRMAAQAGWAVIRIAGQARVRGIHHAGAVVVAGDAREVFVAAGGLMAVAAGIGGVRARRDREERRVEVPRHHLGVGVTAKARVTLVCVTRDTRVGRVGVGLGMIVTGDAREGAEVGGLMASAAGRIRMKSARDGEVDLMLGSRHDRALRMAAPAGRTVVDVAPDPRMGRVRVGLGMVVAGDAREVFVAAGGLMAVAAGIGGVGARRDREERRVLVPRHHLGVGVTAQARVTLVCVTRDARVGRVGVSLGMAVARDAGEDQVIVRVRMAIAALLGRVSRPRADREESSVIDTARRSVAMAVIACGVGVRIARDGHMRRVGVGPSMVMARDARELQKRRCAAVARLTIHPGVDRAPDDREIGPVVRSIDSVAFQGWIGR